MSARKTFSNKTKPCYKDKLYDRKGYCGKKKKKKKKTIFRGKEQPKV